MRRRGDPWAGSAGPSARTCEEGSTARDPRVGLSGVAGGFAILSGVFLGILGGRVSWLPAAIAFLGILLLINMQGGPLRQPLLIAHAFVLGALSLPLMLNGSGVILLIGCIAAVAAIFYREPGPDAAVPEWLVDRRHGQARRKRRSAPLGPAPSQAQAQVPPSPDPPASPPPSAPS